MKRFGVRAIRLAITGVISVENWPSFVKSGMLHPASISRVGWQLTAAGQKHFEEDICARLLWGCCCLVQ